MALSPEVGREYVALALERGDSPLLRVEGVSMGRTLTPPCRVRVCRMERPPRPGDIVLIELRGDLVAHRVISEPRRDSGAVVTKGDTCFEADGLIRPQQVLGLATAVERDGREYRPWHWRMPWARAVALLSRLDAAIWPWMRGPAHRMYRRLRLYAIRNQLREWAGRSGNGESDATQ